MYITIPQILIDSIIPIITVLLAGLVSWLVFRLSGITENENRHTVNLIVRQAVVFYFKTNLDDIVEKSISEKVDVLTNYVERYLHERGYEVSLDELDAIITHNLIDLNDKLEAIYHAENKPMEKES